MRLHHCLNVIWKLYNIYTRSIFQALFHEIITTDACRWYARASTHFPSSDIISTVSSALFHAMPSPITPDSIRIRFFYSYFFFSRRKLMSYYFIYTLEFLLSRSISRILLPSSYYFFSHIHCTGARTYYSLMLRIRHIDIIGIKYR